MSADHTLLYYGIRLSIEDENDFEEYEEQRHPRQVAARSQGLDTFWDNFRTEDGQDRYLIFIGTEIGALGYEDSFELSVANDKLLALMAETKAKLYSAGFTDIPALLAQFAPDDHWVME